MPVRDGAADLPEAIASLEAQSFQEFDTIVVDDGSRDSSPQILREWARRDRRVRILWQPQRGIARALDRGLNEARTPFIARMDADDIALPNRLEKQLEALRDRPDLAVLGTHVSLFPRERLKEGMKRYERWLTSLVTSDEILRDLLIESPLCHPSIMARRQNLRDVGGYRDVDGPEDYDLWLRLARAGYQMANLPEVLLRWRDRPDRATRVDQRYRERAIIRLKLRNLLSWRLGGAPSVGIWGAGPFGKRWSRLLVRQGIQVSFFVEVNRRKIGQTIHGAPVISIDQLPPPGEVVLLICVGVDGARALIRGELFKRDWVGQDDVIYLQ